MSLFNVLSVVAASRRPLTSKTERGSKLMMAYEMPVVTGGVDTHRDIHVAAVIDHVGRVLGTEAFPANPKGYALLLRWMRSFGSVAKIGIEGTGSYGAGLTRMLEACRVDVVEVNRPNRQVRRRRGKSDTVDAESAARVTLNGEATAIPKSADNEVESVRMLRVARRSAVKARSQATNQIHTIVVTAPDKLRSQLDGLSTRALIDVCARFRPDSVDTTSEAARTALRLLARRCQALTNEIEQLDDDINQLINRHNPALLGVVGVGPEVAATLLITAGGNPDRLHSDAAFAAMCGACPVEASSGKIVRHRLNTGGNRQANNALWRIVMVRLSTCERTRAFAAKKRSEGKTVKETIRILKRSVAREIYRIITNPPDIKTGPELRGLRKAAGLTQPQVAEALDTTVARISRLELGKNPNNHLATRYHQWLQQQAT